MNHKSLSFLPLIIFLLLLTGIGYLMFSRERPIVDPTPTPTEEKTPATEVAAVTSTATVTSPTMTSTPTSLPSPTLTPVPPTLTDSPTTAPSSTSIVTFTPSSTYTPTPTLTPTSLPIGIVTVENLNVRWGPSLDYLYAGALYKDDKIIILGSTPDRHWLQIETPNLRNGWVSARYIEVIGNINDIPIVSLPPTPFPTPLLNPSSETRTLEMGKESVSGVISPGQGQDYTFLGVQKIIVFVLMFKPNVNSNQSDQVQFVLYYQDQIGQSRIIGLGSPPASDRDGDLGTGELVWRGGPLVLNTPYYLRIINNSSELIRYCLATTDTYQWDCSQN